MREVKVGVPESISLFHTKNADHTTGMPGLSLNVLVCVPGGEFVDGDGIVLDKGYGWYDYIPSIGEVSTLGETKIHSYALEADACDRMVVVVPVREEDTLAAVQERATPAQVNAEMVDVLRVDTLVELLAGEPSATPTFAEALMLIYMALRNTTRTTRNEYFIYNSAGDPVCRTVLSEDAVEFLRYSMVAP